MKKIILFSVLLWFALASGAYALPLWGEAKGVSNSFEYGGFNYTIYDKSSEGDIYNDAVKGYYIGNNDYSGFYLGTISGNDINGKLTTLISYYLQEIGKLYQIEDSIKLDEIEKIGGSSGSNEGLTVTWDDGLKSGTWSISGQYAGVGFYAVKGGPEFALYFVDPALQSGFWTTRHLLNGGNQNPEISHFTVVTTQLPPTPVPEPSTILLLGAGLVGLAVYGRSRRVRQE